MCNRTCNTGRPIISSRLVKAGNQKVRARWVMGTTLLKCKKTYALGSYYSSVDLPMRIQVVEKGVSLKE